MKRYVWTLVIAAGCLGGCKQRDAASALRDDDVPAASGDDLDQRYGVAYLPGYYKQFETNPDGTTIRNPKLQTCAADAPLVPNHAVNEIWAILEDGTLVMGDEIVVGTDASGKEEALGHPTLTNAGKARIAGEFRWDGDAPYINNKSGRYSEHPDRTATQLTNAAGLFHSCGVDVQTKFFSMPMHPPPGAHLTPFGPSQN